MQEVKLHDIGEGMTEAEVTDIFVKRGDRVDIDQPLVEVLTDKVTAEIPSPAAGMVQEIHVNTGDRITVGTTMMTIVSSSQKPASQTSSPSSAAASRDKRNKTKPAPRRPLRKGRVLATPYTRKIARSHGVDIEKIVGTGPIGRVTEEDVYAFIKNAEEAQGTPAARQTPQLGAAPVEEGREIPLRGRRKQIAKKMAQSLYTIPHVTHFDEVDMTELLHVKASLKAADPDNEKGLNVSVAAFFIKALQLALADFPIFNAKLDEDKEVIRLEPVYNIGIAVDTEEGLIVPVIKNVEQLSIKAIHTKMKTLIQKAKANALSASDLRGGTFTVSNVGPLGSTAATPIINHPEVALLAMHKTKKMPVVRGNDEIVIRQMMNVSLSFDHRVADGAQAVAFTNRLINYIEHPYTLLVQLV